MPYVIAELKPGEQGGFEPRGAVRELWKSRDFETMVAGPAETGKTWGAVNYLDALLWRYPGAQGVMVRKTYTALVPSALRTYRRVIGPDSPITFFGGEKPEWAQYPNGSRLWFVGLDNPGKALSTERDFFYVNQAEEVTIEDWETLITRCTGRGAVMPYTRIFGDCNPGPPTHWIKNRLSLRVLESRHEDNPTLFDDAGNITAQGVKSLAALDSLTGVRKERLRYGRWVQAEGAVYEEFDAAVHIIDRTVQGYSRDEIPASWPSDWAIDFGYTNPFVWHEWVQDPDGRIYLRREIYRTQTLVEDHAKRILQLSEGRPRPRSIICDHDAEDRATLERHLRMRTIAAHKAIPPGIQAVQQRLRKAGDGRPRIHLFRDALDERDESLVAARKPCSTAQEFEVYVWPKAVDGKPVKEVPVDQDNHGMDTMRYRVAQTDVARERKAAEVPRGINPVEMVAGFRQR